VKSTGDRPRIGIIGSRGVPAHYGGFETFATEISTRLVERGFDVTVYCRARYSLPDKPAMYKGVRLVYLPAPNRKVLESVAHEFVSVGHALTQRYDLLYVLGFRASLFYLPLALAGKKVFFNTDGLDWQRRKWSRFGRRYLKLSEQIGVRLAPTRLIVDSRAIGSYFARSYGVKPRYLTYGANIVPPSNPAIVREYGLEPRQYFLVLCRIEPENNVDIIVKAFARIRTDKKLAIVGGANYQSDYFAEIKASASENVVFLGPVYTPGHIEELYGWSSAYIHGHEVGGTNPALLQGMGCGACVLAHDVEYNREVLGDAGLYWPRDPDTLARILEQVEAGDFEALRLGEAAVNRVREYYCWDRIADEYATYFRQQLGQAAPSDAFLNESEAICLDAQLARQSLD
jgi:glycosyltransferase involved in cell wall biosynthesis